MTDMWSRLTMSAITERTTQDVLAEMIQDTRQENEDTAS